MVSRQDPETEDDREEWRDDVNRHAHIDASGQRESEHHPFRVIRQEARELNSSHQGGFVRSVGSGVDDNCREPM